MVSSVANFLRTLGPGVLMATAAIGGSHLVSSTQAGAKYGWQLAGLILLVNLLKYPFFRCGIQYTLGTHKTLVEGYEEMGRLYLIIFAILAVFSAFVNTAAILLFCAHLMKYFLPSLDIFMIAVIVLVVSLAILLAGHYKLLNRLGKVIMLLLAVTSIIAFIIALRKGGVAPVGFEGPSPWTFAAVGFIVIMMGWMPAPIEISAITSSWLSAQQRTNPVSEKEALRDFNIGYMGTAILALVFVGLGALTFYGSGEDLKTSGIGFTHQFVEIYASTIGDWSKYLMVLIAFFCMFGTNLTVIDGYSRVIAVSQEILTAQKTEQRHNLVIWTIIVGVVGLLILKFFTTSLVSMLDFAMIMAFVTTPIFALLNYLLVKRAKLPENLRTTGALNGLSIIGLIYLFGFLAFFLYWKFIM